MKNVVHPFAGRDDEASWEGLIEALYAHSDQTAEVLSLRPKADKPLSRPEDMSIVADVIEALKDDEQARFARPALRHALQEIAKAALGGKARQRVSR